MLDLALCRARAALPSDALRERRRMGARVLSALRALAHAVEGLLPEFGSLARFASRPDAATLSVGWRPAGTRRADAPRLAITARADRLDVSWGYGPPVAARGEATAHSGRDRWLALSARARRELGDTLAIRLAALRSAGAELHGAHRDTTPVSEDDWVRAAAGAVVFSLPDPPEGALLVHLVADRLARLGWLAVRLGGADLAPRVEPARALPEALASLRSLRWDERSLGAGAAPVDLVPTGRVFAYDPATGWFAPEVIAGARGMSASRLRLATEAAPGPGSHSGLAGAIASIAPAAPVERGLHARLARWQAARGVRAVGADAGGAEVRVLGAMPAPGEVPALEVLVARVLEDPSGDAAAAIAGLLAGAPWSYADPLDPAAVAARVPPRFAASAARGVATLAERGLLVRGVTGSLESVGDCLADPAVRPVLAGAVARALGHLDVFPPGARERSEAGFVRAWELGASGARAATLESVSRRFCRYARAAGITLDIDLVRAFSVGLRAKPFAVLAGVSGTGKTRLAQLFARFMTEALPGGAAGDHQGARVAIVPVRPDWLDSRALLGYFNVLHGGTVGAGAYEDTAALRVILRAARHPDEPHFLVLDEMNLARVEHYLAEVLSAMESGEAIPLHGRPGGAATVDGARTIPPSVPMPVNLFVVGTVNVDETTHAFSAKVLDRAWTWEFPTRPPTALLRDWLGERRTAEPATDDERRALLGAGAPEDPVRPLVLAMGRDGVGARIDRIFEAMSAARRPFGFRVATEVLRFVYLCEREGIEAPPAWWLDHAILGKVLPRVAGTRREIEGLLRALLLACAPAPRGFSGTSGVADRAGAAPAEDLVATATKLREMLSRLDTEAFVTFAR